VKREITDASRVPGVRRGALRRRPAGDEKESPARWRHAEVVGRLVELSSHTGRSLIDRADGAGAGVAGAARATTVLTLALALVRDAQRLGETTAWVGVDRDLFFPPDAAQAGIDLAALPIVRAPQPADVPRAAERLVRSGAFGLVVLDLTAAGRRVRVPPALLNRLAALAREHEAAVVCLTEKSADAASLGPLVSLRAAARRGASEVPGRCLAVLDVLRDRRRPGRWRDTVACRAPEGVETILPHAARR
jgi:recombination protein RecA